MLAFLAGDAAVRPYRAMFRAANPQQHVRCCSCRRSTRCCCGSFSATTSRGVGSRSSSGTTCRLAGARRRAFLDFDRVWEDQRRRWQPLVDSDGSAAQQAAVAPDTALDVPGRGVVASPRGRTRRASAVPSAPASSPLPPSSASPVAGSPLASLAEGRVSLSPAGDGPDASEDPPASPPVSVSSAGAPVAGAGVSSAGGTGVKGAAAVAAAYSSYHDLVHVFDLWRPADWAGVRIGSRALARGSEPPPR